MKTAVSIPDGLFADADRVAQRLGQSRSALYAQALREFLARHDQEAVTAALDRVYATTDEEDAFVAAASRRVLQDSEW